jgi:hypothetical protein
VKRLFLVDHEPNRTLIFVFSSVPDPNPIPDPDPPDPHFWGSVTDPDPLVRGMDQDLYPAPDADPSIIKQI